MNYTPTEKDIKQLKKHKQHLENATLGYYCPKISSLKNIESLLNRSISLVPEAAVDEATKEEQLKKLHSLSGLLIFVLVAAEQHRSAKTIPSPKEFQQFKDLEYALNELHLPALKFEYIPSVLRGEYLVQKHETSKGKKIPKHIQRLKDEEREEKNSKF